MFGRHCSPFWSLTDPLASCVETGVASAPHIRRNSTLIVRRSWTCCRHCSRTAHGICTRGDGAFFSFVPLHPCRCSHPCWYPPARTWFERGEHFRPRLPGHPCRYQPWTFHIDPRPTYHNLSSHHLSVPAYSLCSGGARQMGSLQPMQQARRTAQRQKQNLQQETRPIFFLAYFS